MQNTTRLSLLLFILLLAGCASAALTAAPSPSATPLQPISTLQPSPTPQPSLTPTPAGCTETRGQVKSFAVFSTEIGKPMAVRVYTPPCYDPTADPGYPVLYLLHGQSFDDGQWQRLGVPEIADRLIDADEVKPFLVVMPQEYYYLADISQSAFGQALIDELLPWVEENYAVCRETACRAIGGLSRGASWAVRLGYEYWPTFGAIGLHSLPSSSNGSIFYNWLPKIPEDQRPRLYLDIGAKDPYLSYALEFEGMLNDARLVHEWHLNPGTHNEEYWSAHVEEYLRWYAAGW